MARIDIGVKYNANVEISEILSLSEKFINMNEDKDQVKEQIQLILQTAFDSGRQFQKEHGNLETS